MSSTESPADMPALHPRQRLLFLRRRYVRRITLLLLIVCARLHAQNIEGQIVASQFGQFQVPGTADASLWFSPASCQVSGGGKNFSAFETGVPIKIVDSNPAMTEIDTPAAVFIDACSVSMSTTYLHAAPFYLTSGTGGLQEALSNGIQKSGGPTTVILTADWYAQVSPGNPATVIASVKGSTALGLIDVTTAPYTAYDWNGTQYVAIANGGGSANFPGTPGIVYNTSVSAAQNATSSQIATQLNASPSTTLVPALLPTASNSLLGIVKGDGTTTSVNGSGAISALPPTGAANLIVATPNGSSGTAAPRAMVAADMPAATSSAFGAVKPDNTTITISGGVISSVGGGGGTPGGSPTNVQFYGASTFAGDSTFTFNNSSHTLAFQNGTSGATAPAGDNSTKVANTAAVFNSQPALLAQYFGAYGDAYGPPDGCAWTASSTTLTCPDGVFQSTAIDGGKQVWLHSAGPAGVAFHTTIVSVTSNTVAVMAAAPSISLSNTPGNTVFGHDDTAAVQACWQYSASNGVQCTLRASPAPLGGSGFTGFLIGSAGLQLASSNGDTESSATNTTGSSSINGTNLFCEYNGDCVSLAAGPIQGAVFSNINLEGDPSQPNGRGFHFNATAGTYGNGGLWNSTFTNFQTSNFNQECMLSEGGNYLSSGELPNQVDTFINFQCNAPNQMHTANLIKMTGQHAQIIFMNGQTNGPVSASNQPNAMILITEQTSGQGDSATDVKFFGYTYEVGLVGLQLGNGAYNIHYDNGYVENVASPLIAGGNPLHGGVFGLTYNGNHIANSGNVTAVAQFTGGVTGSFRDSLVYGATTPAAFAVCTGTGNTVDFVGNNSTVTTTTGCATSSASPSTSTLTITGGASASIAASGTPILTINAPGINSGKTLTLYAAGTFTLGTGGNINLGGLTSPLVVPSGGSLTLTLLDQGTTWLVTSTTAGTSVAARKGTFTCTAGGTISIANTHETATSDVVISLNIAGGTISTPPAMKTVTTGTGFTVQCGAADTSTYNYDILN
jgi:hypothetical protein